jgi:hypothetical protein
MGRKGGVVVGLSSTGEEVETRETTPTTQDIGPKSNKENIKEISASNLDPACRNPSFGLATKARGCKVAGVKRKEGRELKGRKPGSKGKRIGRVRAKRRKPGSHHILPRV